MKSASQNWPLHQFQLNTFINRKVDQKLDFDRENEE